MRKVLASVLGLSMGLMLIYGAIGSGAQFLFQGEADQQIQMGTLGYTISTDTGAVSGNTVTCNALLVTQSSNWAYVPQGHCHVTITKTGNIDAAINVFGKATGTFPTAHLGSFNLYANASPTWLSGGGIMLLSTPNVDPSWGFAVGIVNGPATSVTFDFAYSWGEPEYLPDLVNGDMGTFIQMVYTFSASA